ncbi:hypothetical protein IAG44_10930 [Streptomyces roseirectus]|uniref:Uncharacterized protein n=1 Tax=Streptomyces roseirectus TaxID=2768066 RepID=A0A7H0IAU7_9ACTN|nr:hypothetical protein [Streptomyces roseirectus]QNP69913.1 hypothetical protein IAG44_10930 [Streptomyces roseirectus]
MGWGRRRYDPVPCEYCGEPVPQDGRRWYRRRKRYCGWRHRAKASVIKRVFDAIDGFLDAIGS